MNKFLVKLFVKLVCPQVSVKISDDEINCFDTECDRIYFNPDDTEDFGFLRHMTEVHQCPITNKLSLTIWTLLHEIGHYHTIDFVDDEEDEELNARIAYAVLENEDVKNNITIQDQYFNLDSEWQATEWAIDFATSHFLFCKVFAALLR